VYVQPACNENSSLLDCRTLTDPKPGSPHGACNGSITSAAQQYGNLHLAPDAKATDPTGSPFSSGSSSTPETTPDCIAGSARPNSSSPAHTHSNKSSSPPAATATTAGQRSQLSESSSSSSNNSNVIALADLQELSVIGSGSSGVVKKVLHKPSGSIYVLKVINFDMGSEVIRRQVTTEVKAMDGSRHPHVVAYHQSYFTNGNITILMELMDGGSLWSLLQKVLLDCHQVLAPAAGGIGRNSSSSSRP
jgi:hypothetical protein